MKTVSVAPEVQDQGPESGFSVSMAAPLHIPNHSQGPRSESPTAHLHVPLTLSPAVLFLRRASRLLTAVSCSSLWLITQQEVFSVARGTVWFLGLGQNSCINYLQPIGGLSVAHSVLLQCGQCISSAAVSHSASALPCWWLTYSYATDSMTQLIHSEIDWELWFKPADCVCAFKSEYVQIRLNPHG